MADKSDFVRLMDRSEKKEFYQKPNEIITNLDWNLYGCRSGFHLSQCLLTHLFAQEAGPQIWLP
jgi:hypothetical protein